MATTPVDSGGIQSTPSPMVAVPGAKEAPVILGTGIGMAMPKMECKINLRGGNQDAWRRWLVNRNDVITAHGLDALMDNQLMPTSGDAVTKHKARICVKGNAQVPRGESLG